MLSFRTVRRDPEHDASAFSDLVAVLRQRVAHRWLFIALAIGIPGLFIIGFIAQFTVEKDYHPPEVIFFKNWNANRSEAAIKAQQALDAPQERAERAEIKAFEEKRKAQFRKLAEQMGYDVDNSR